MAGVSPVEVQALLPILASPVQGSCAGKVSPTIAGSGNQRVFSLLDLVGRRAARGLDALLWSWRVDSLAGKHSPGLWHWEYHIGSPRSLWGRTVLNAFYVGAGDSGAIVPSVRSLHIVDYRRAPFVSGLSPPTKGQVWDFIGLVE